MLRYLPFLLVLAVWIYAFIDCLNTPEQEVRKLPKVVWVIIILLFGQVVVGPVAWFAVGRPRKNAPYGATRPDERRWVAPDDNPEFLKSINDGAPPRGSDDDEDADMDIGMGVDSDAAEKRNGTSDDGDTSGAEPQEAELHRREEESRRRENGGGGPDETPPQGH
jgi:hypothetical protein